MKLYNTYLFGVSKFIHWWYCHKHPIADDEHGSHIAGFHKQHWIQQNPLKHLKFHYNSVFHHSRQSITYITLNHTMKLYNTYLFGVSKFIHWWYCHKHPIADDEYGSHIAGFHKQHSIQQNTLKHLKFHCNSVFHHSRQSITYLALNHTMKLYNTYLFGVSKFIYWWYCHKHPIADDEYGSHIADFHKQHSIQQNQLKHLKFHYNSALHHST